MIRLIQITDGTRRRVAVVEEPQLRLLKAESTYELVRRALAGGRTLSDEVRAAATDETLDYDSIYQGGSMWRILPPLDHPEEPARCLVSGTGLTHLGSAKDRASMHGSATAQMTDSMRMFQWGLEGGRPKNGEPGIAPEWFFKGTGTILRGHGDALDLPAYGEDGGEEAEIAGLYVIGDDGAPCRVGMCVGNEFSDHVFEKKNYLNLAGSKIRTCSIGPELCIDPVFDSVAGSVAIRRGDQIVWSKAIQTGESEMSHSLRNLEHHHFKFETHRRPGDVHVHFFGAHSLSFGEGVRLQDGDEMVVAFDGFGRALRNRLAVHRGRGFTTAVVPLR